MLKLKLLAVFIIALFVTPALAQDKPEQSAKNEIVQDLYNLGLSAFGKKQYEKSRDLFLKAISYDDSFVEAHAKLGDTYQALKEEELGYESYKKCLQIISRLENPSEETLKLAEDIQQKMKRFKELENKIAAINQEFIDRIMPISSQSLEKRDYLLATNILTLVSRLAIDNEEAIEGLKKAKEDFLRELNENKIIDEAELAKTYCQDGWDLFKKSKYAEAAEKFQKATVYRDYIPDAYFGLGECSARLNDPVKAVNSYRHCLRLLELASQHSKEENDLQTRAAKALEKVDTLGREFRKAKSEYVSKLESLVREWMQKKYQRFAYLAIQQIRLVEPDHKAANEALAKIDKKTIQAQATEESSSKQKLVAKGPPKKLFNGTDLNGWEALYCQLENWNVVGGKIEGGPSCTGENDAYAILGWLGEVPKNFILTIKFLPGAIINPKLGGAEVGGIYSKKHLWLLARHAGLAKGANTLELIAQNDQLSLLLNNTLVFKMARDDYDPKVGIYARNIKIFVSSVTLQEIE